MYICLYNMLKEALQGVRLVRGIADSHHKHKLRLDIEEFGCLAVDIAGYLSVSILMGILFINIIGPVA